MFGKRGFVAVIGLVFFSFLQASQEIDYGQLPFWIAHPKKHSVTSQVPDHSLNPSFDPKVDLFYVHPTTYMPLFFIEGVQALNASVSAKTDDPSQDESLVARLQASIFNESCQIYAPRYRQAVGWAFSDEITPQSRQQALDLAYGDVKAAFYAYLKENPSRPFVIASHSQGSYHAARLIKEVIDRDPKLRKRLVIAYLIGEKIGDEQFDHVKVAEHELQTHGFVSWATLRYGAKSCGYLTGEPKGRVVCVNPLNWQRDGKKEPQSKHLGGVVDAFNRLDRQMLEAEVVEERLRISKPLPGYSNESGDYHESDVNLFYLDIRENVKRRIEAYFKE